MGIHMAHKSLILVFLALAVLVSSAAVSGLTITDVDLDSADEENIVKPGEVLRIDFSVLNDGADELEDVTAEIGFFKNGKALKDNDRETIDSDFDLKDLDTGEDDSASFTFTIPWDVEHDDKYAVVIKARGENSRTRETVETEDGSSFFTVRKQSHDLIVYDTEFEPYPVGCPRKTVLHVTLRNIGKNDEDNVNLTVRNKNIGVEIQEKLSLEGDADSSSNVFEKEYPITLSNLENLGKYPVFLRAVFGLNREVTKSMNISVDTTCNSAEPDSVTGLQTGNTSSQGNSAQQNNTIQQSDDGAQAQENQPAAQQQSASQNTPKTTYIPTQNSQAQGTQPSRAAVIGLAAAVISAIILIIILAILVVKGR